MTDRHEKIAELLAHEAAQYVAAEANADPLITITRASISTDYRRATVFFTTIPDEKQEAALIFLKRSAGDVRHFIMKRNQLKIVPHLDFEVDYGERHRQHIDEIVREHGIESTFDGDASGSDGGGD